MCKGKRGRARGRAQTARVHAGMFGSECARSLDKVVPHAIIDLQLHGSPGGVGPGDELKVVTQEHLVATNHLRAKSEAGK